MNVTEVQDLFWSGMVNIFGHSIIVLIVAFGFLAYLCITGRMTVEQSAMVFIPAVFGIVSDAWLPVWIKGLFLMAMGMVWGLALIRLTR